jgi:hypothetical protein
MNGSNIGHVGLVPWRHADPEHRELELRQADRAKRSCNCIWYVGDREIKQLLLGYVLECHRCRRAIWLDDASFLSYGRSIAVRYDGSRKDAVIDVWNAGFWLAEETRP